MSDTQKVNILDELEHIANRICDDYCKWPQEYGCQDDYDSDEFEKMSDEKCQNCPIYQFFYKNSEKENKKQCQKTKWKKSQQKWKNSYATKSAKTP